MLIFCAHGGGGSKDVTTIYLDAVPHTDLTDYNGLVTSIGKWLERDDLEGSIPDFIKLAEARFRRELVMPDMELQVPLTPAATVALPADFDSIRALGIAGYDAIDQLSLADFYALPLGANGEPQTGQPTKFAIVAGSTAGSQNFAFWPVPDKSYPALLTYRANLPSLTSISDTNWLLKSHPDAYLFGCLVQAEFFDWNDDRLPLIKGALDEIMSSIMVSGVRKRYGSGPLTMKPAVNERIGLRR